jgi:F420H(2)-dependent quinone reductase
MTEQVELSSTDWVREHTERILRQHSTDGAGDGPVVLFTVAGAKSGRRYVPLMRVEEGGRYAMVASKGGAPEHPGRHFNVNASPTVTLQDGDTMMTPTAGEIDGQKREYWWKLATRAYPPYAEYQTKTSQLIPLLKAE